MEMNTTPTSDNKDPFIRTGTIHEVRWHKVLVVTIGVLILILIAGYLGYWYGSMNNSTIQNSLSLNSTATTTEAATITSTTTPTTDPYAGWSTFNANSNGSTYNYSFKYPNGWTISKLISGTMDEISVKDSTGYEFRFNYAYDKTQGIDTFTQYIGKYADTTIDDRKFTKVYFNFNGQDGSCSTKVTTIPTECSSKYNTISIVDSTDRSGFGKTEHVELYTNKTAIIDFKFPSALTFTDTNAINHDEIFTNILASIKLPTNK